MGVFDNILGSEESLFRDDVALDYDYMPKLIPYREKEQFKIASAMKPLFVKRNGRNLFIYGKPGVGKTVACRHVLNELEEKTEDIIPFYINCWQKNTTYKIILEMCNIIGYKFTQNKKTEELFDVLKGIINKKSAVFVFDEIDKVEDFSFLYSILENIYRKSIILITNYSNFIQKIDDRVKSRLTPEMLEFKPYNLEETGGILKQRMEYAFNDVWDDDAFDAVVKKCYEMKDIRLGLFLMRESGIIAEDRSSRRITIDDVKKAIDKVDKFTKKDENSLDSEERMIFNIIKENSGKKIGDLFKIYQEMGGTSVYRTFQRKINKLASDGFISIEKVTGKGGNTTIVRYEKVKRLTDF